MSLLVTTKPNEEKTTKRAVVATPQVCAIPEFVEMLATSKKIAEWRLLEEGSRLIEVGYLPNEKKPALYRKTAITARERRLIPDEELVYLLSHNLKLGAVPVTLCIAHEIPRVLQKAVDGSLPYTQAKEVSVASTALLNIIAGRRDAAQIDNSVVDATGTLFEVDNEVMGFSQTNSWLFEKYPTVEISPSLKAHLAKFTENDVEKILTEFAKRHPTRRLPPMVVKNFTLLKEALNTTKKVTLFDLKKFYSS